MNPINRSKSDLVINDEVFTAMAGTAALEVAGVAGLKKAQINDIKSILTKNSGGTDGVRVSRKDGEIVLDVFIAVKRDFKIMDVAEAVQNNVKKTVQDMTNCAVSRVNVHIADVEIPKEAPVH